MQLQPLQPPGRCTRKARAFETEIARLYIAGYTLGAIREALAAAGVEVSKTTIRREIARHPPTSAKATPASPYTSAQSPPAPQTRSPSASSPPGIVGLGSGKEVAQAFAMSHITNPLVRPRN